MKIALLESFVGPEIRGKLWIMLDSMIESKTSIDDKWLDANLKYILKTELGDGITYGLTPEIDNALNTISGPLYEFAENQSTIINKEL